MTVIPAILYCQYKVWNYGTKVVTIDDNCFVYP